MGDPLADLVGEVDRLLAVQEPSGLVRLGSTARGEPAPLDARGRSSSDIEYLCVAHSKAVASDVEKRVGMARASACHSFADVHVTVLSPGQLRWLRRTFWLWEAAAGGKCVSGHDFRPLLPDVSVENLDFEELNETLLWRMYRLVEYASTPEAEVSSSLRLRGALRQALDLPTWFLPHRGLLRVGFTARLRLFEELAVPDHVIRLVKHAWLVRNAPEMSVVDDAVEWTARGLLWGDDTRLRHKYRTFSDRSPRSLASRGRFFARAGQLTPARIWAIANSRRELHRRLRPLVEELADGGLLKQGESAAWVDRAAPALAFGKRNIEWLAAEDAVQ
jgi:hypothetical protein